MLVAKNCAERVEAATAEKGPVYCCPVCEGEVVLKQGRKVVHHFSHKPSANCEWGVGETRAHMSAKLMLLAHFRAKGLQADVEYPVGDQRADVRILNSKGESFVFEIQHSPLEPNEISRRTSGYFKAGAAVMWVSIIDSAYVEQHKNNFIDRYSPKTFERWLDVASPSGVLWFIDPTRGVLWHGSFVETLIDVPSTDFGGGYSYPSRRWVGIRFKGPFELSNLKFRKLELSAKRINRIYYRPRYFAICASQIEVPNE